MNFAIRKLRDDIINLINGSKLPIEIIRLILREILVEVDNKATLIISEEMKKINEEIEEDAVHENNMD